MWYACLVKKSHLNRLPCLCQKFSMINTLMLDQISLMQKNIFLYLVLYLVFFLIHLSEIVAKCNPVTETTTHHVHLFYSWPKMKILSKIKHACTGNSYDTYDYRFPFLLMLGSPRAGKTLTYLSNEDPGGGPGRVAGVCGRGTPVEVWSRCPGRGIHRPCRPLECNSHSDIYTWVDLLSFSQEGRRISTIY